MSKTAISPNKWNHWHEAKLQNDLTTKSQWITYSSNGPMAFRRHNTNLVCLEKSAWHVFYKISSPNIISMFMLSSMRWWVLSGIASNQWAGLSTAPWSNITNIMIKIKISFTHNFFHLDHMFWNFVPSISVILLCFIQNFNMISQLKWVLWTNEILSLQCIILQ